MARIRTIKPDCFRHELLQDLQSAHPDLNPMLIFIGLWTQCDKNGVFEYKPRQLKLDILPFMAFDMGASLTLLREAKMISLMLHGEKVYGYIPTFNDHQRISGREAQEDSKFPQPCEMIEWNSDGTIPETIGKQQGSTEEVIRTTGREGKGREGKGEGDVPAKPSRPTKKKLTDDEFMQELRDNPIYAGLDIDRLKGKMEAWCASKGLTPSRARLVNWLNKEDKPLAPSATEQTYEKPEWQRGMR